VCQSTPILKVPTLSGASPLPQGNSEPPEKSNNSKRCRYASVEILDLGDKFVRGYVAVKRAEHENFKRVISSWEREFLMMSV